MMNYSNEDYSLYTSSNLMWTPPYHLNLTNQIISSNSNEDTYFDFDSFSSDLEILELIQDVNDQESKTVSGKEQKLNSTNPSLKDNNQYVNALLNLPNMTPARLAILMNFKENTHPIPRPKKRQKMNEDDNHDNKRYSYQYHPRSQHIFHFDLRNDFMKMFFNVLNSADMTLYRKFVIQYFEPNCLIIKSSKTSNGLFPTIKYRTCGREKLLVLQEFINENTPDYILRLYDVIVKTDPLTNQSILMAPFRGSGTKTKFQIKLFLKFLSKLRDYSNALLQSMLSSTSSSSPSSPTASSSSSFSFSSSSSSFSSASSVTSSCPSDGDIKSTRSTLFEEEYFLENQSTNQNTQIKDLTFDSYFQQHVDSFTPVSFDLSEQITNVLYRLSPLNFYHLLKLSVKQLYPTLLLTPSLPGIRGQADCVFTIHLNENQRVNQLEFYVGQIRLELASGEMLR